MSQQLANIDGGSQNREFVEVLKQIYDSRNELTAIPLQQYQSLFSELMRDDIQIILPRDERDMFSEELRIIIQNLQISAYQQKIELKIYNSDSTLLSSEEMVGEKALLV